MMIRYSVTVFVPLLTLDNTADPHKLDVQVWIGYKPMSTRNNTPKHGRDQKLFSTFWLYECPPIP